jgi:hypothetical protein
MLSVPIYWRARRECRNCEIADEAPLSVRPLPPPVPRPLSLDGGVCRALASAENVRSIRARLEIPKCFSARRECENCEAGVDQEPRPFMETPLSPSLRGMLEHTIALEMPLPTVDAPEPPLTPRLQAGCPGVAHDRCPLLPIIACSSRA